MRTRTQAHHVRGLARIFWILIATFLIVPWCIAVPPLSLFGIPLLVWVIRASAK